MWLILIKIFATNFMKFALAGEVIHDNKFSFNSIFLHEQSRL